MNERLSKAISLVVIGTAVIWASFSCRRHRDSDDPEEERTGGYSYSPYHHGGMYWHSGGGWRSRAGNPAGSVRGGFGYTGRSVGS